MIKIYYLALIALSLLPTWCFAAPAVNSGDLDLRVMSFNIRNGTGNDGEDRWEFRKEFVYDVIRDDAPDVLGLQEAVRFQLDAFNQHLPEYGEVGIGANGETNGQYVSILYLKDRFEVNDSGTFWLSDTPAHPSKSWGNHHLRNCTWARLIDKATQQSFYVYNTHMDDGSQPSREKGIRLIMKHLQAQAIPAPFILMGDFNVAEDNPVIAYLNGSEDDAGHTPARAIDTFRARHPEVKDVGTFNGFTGLTSGAKIDYIFASPETLTLEAGIVRTSREGRYPSDHFPVTAHLRFKQKDGSTGEEKGIKKEGG